MSGFCDRNRLVVSPETALAGEGVVGSKVERVKSSREMKTSKAQMKIVDWALDNKGLELLLLKEEEAMADDFAGGPDEVEQSLVLSASELKKTTSKPMPLFSVLPLPPPVLLLSSTELPFADKPIS